MQITHIAIWTRDIDRVAAFWRSAFGAGVGTLYESINRPGFFSRWLTLPGGPQIELMTGPWVAPATEVERMGYAHVALSLGSTEAVDAMALLMKEQGALVNGPRQTGDGFYEALVSDPEGNLIEITV
jgi:lactoylglutathione lyase